MSRYQKVDIKEINLTFAKEIQQMLDEYGAEAQEIVYEEADKTGQMAKQMLAGNSPSKTGKYRKGWKKKTESTRYSRTVIVYEGTQPTLTWLLENGHALMRGGRKIGDVRPHKHIIDAEEYAEGYFYDNVVRRLG